MLRVPLTAALLTLVTEAAPVDLTRAVIAASPTLAGPGKKAVTVLVEEIERRTQIRPSTSAAAPANGPAIVVERSPAGGPAEGNWTAANDRNHIDLSFFHLVNDTIGSFNDFANWTISDSGTARREFGNLRSVQTAW